MDEKIKIELTIEDVEKFKLFCLIEQEAKLKPWRHTQTQILSDGRIIIHIKVN